MGMYTGLAFSVPLTDFGQAVVTALHGARTTKPTPFAPVVHAWGSVANKWPLFEGWAKVGRSNFIPFGAIAYVEFEDAFEEQKSDLKGPIWHVACSLKNYEKEISTFLSDVLPYLISDPCEVLYLYEEDDEPTVRTVEPIMPPHILTLPRARND